MIPNYSYPYSYMQSAVPQQQAQNSAINWVQGESGAKSFGVLPGQSALLMDSEDSVFYIKTADASGMPLPLRIFDYKERMPVSKIDTPIQKQQDYVTRDELEKRLAEVLNGKSTIPVA